MPESIVHARERAVAIRQWAVERTAGKLGRPGKRTHLAGASFALCADLHSAITTLSDSGLHTAVFTMARPITEAYALGYWMLNVAPEEFVERYWEGTHTMTLKKLLPLVMNHHGSKLKDKKLLDIANDFDSLTHGGINHLMMRMRNGPSGKLYRDEQVSAYLNHSSMILVFAVEAVASGVLIEASREDEAMNEGLEIFCSFPWVGEE